MITAYEMTLGNYVPATRTLMENVSEWFGLVCVIYKMVVGFAFVSVIRGVFMHETFRVANQDDDLMVVQKSRTIAHYKKQMRKLVQLSDTNKDGIITCEEFKHILQNKQVRTWMAALEVQVGDADGLFALMDDGDGYLTLDEIVSAISRLKGSARSIDLVHMKHEMTLNLAHMEEVLEGLTDQVGKLSATSERHRGFLIE